LIIEPCRPSPCRMRARLKPQLPRPHCIQTLRKIFDNREDRHAGQPETAGDQ
jgi:hypothetical protein